MATNSNAFGTFFNKYINAEQIELNAENRIEQMLDGRKAFRAYQEARENDDTLLRDVKHPLLSGHSFGECFDMQVSTKGKPQIRLFPWNTQGKNYDDDRFGSAAIDALIDAFGLNAYSKALRVDWHERMFDPATNSSRVLSVRHGDWWDSFDWREGTYTKGFGGSSWLRKHKALNEQLVALRAGDTYTITIQSNIDAERWAWVLDHMDKPLSQVREDWAVLQAEGAKIAKQNRLMRVENKPVAKKVVEVPAQLYVGGIDLVQVKEAVAFKVTMPGWTTATPDVFDPKASSTVKDAMLKRIANAVANGGKVELA